MDHFVFYFSLLFLQSTIQCTSFYSIKIYIFFKTSLKIVTFFFFTKKELIPIEYNTLFFFNKTKLHLVLLARILYFYFMEINNKNLLKKLINLIYSNNPRQKKNDKNLSLISLGSQLHWICYNPRNPQKVTKQHCRWQVNRTQNNS